MTPFEERVLDVVARIPRGKVLSYGDVAAAAGTRGARAVGAVMRAYGDQVPWHRVVYTDGSPKPLAPEEQLALLVDDGTSMTPDGARVDMARARWDGYV